MKRRDGTKFQPTTEAQIAYIREHWHNRTSLEIAAALGMRPGTVKSWASKLGLRKPQAKLTEIRRHVRVPKSIRAMLNPIVVPRPEHANRLVGELRPIVRADFDRAVVRFDARAGR